MNAQFTLVLAVALCGCGGSYQRIGSMTMLSTRNVDSSKPYVLLKRGAEAEAKMKNDDALQEAVDNAVGMHQGEYMMNVAVYVKENGKKVKVNGDVWGIGGAEGIATPLQTGSSTMVQGDKVAFRLAGKMVTGVIVGLRPNSAMVEYQKGDGKDMREVELEKLTKVQ